MVRKDLAAFPLVVGYHTIDLELLIPGREGMLTLCVLIVGKVIGHAHGDDYCWGDKV